MQRTKQLEQVAQGWEVGEITRWEAIQDNLARLELADGRRFVLKCLGPREDRTIRRLEFERDVLAHVAQTGVTVAAPLPSRDGRPYQIANESIYRLSRWLPNQPVEARTSAERSRLYANYGRAIARFHLALAGYQDTKILERTWQTDLPRRALDQAAAVVGARLAGERLVAFQNALATIEASMRRACADLPRQAIIWDCHPGNVAVDGFEVSGFIDCDHISIAPRILDLGDFLVHLMKWGVGDPQVEAAWMDEFPRLIEGYEEISPLAPGERSALFYSLAAIPLIFMDYFLQDEQVAAAQRELNVFLWLVRRQTDIMLRVTSS